MMLLSVALIAVVGGALAFKANYKSLEVCYTEVAPYTPGSVCQTKLCPMTGNIYLPNTGSAVIYCTTDRNDQDCLQDGVFCNDEDAISCSFE